MKTYMLVKMPEKAHGQIAIVNHKTRTGKKQMQRLIELGGYCVGTIKSNLGPLSLAKGFRALTEMKKNAAMQETALQSGK